MNRKLKNEELSRKSVDEFLESKKNPLVVVLDNVRSLHNVGSVFRSADAFLIEEIFLCGFTGTPPHKEIEKTALGSTQSVKWKHFDTCDVAIENLKAQGYKIAAVEQAEKSLPLNQFEYKGEKLALIFGNEVYGVEQDIINQSDLVLEIPQQGTKHSLNIAVSAGIVLWELVRKNKS